MKYEIITGEEGNKDLLVLVVNDDIILTTRNLSKVLDKIEEMHSNNTPSNDKPFTTPIYPEVKPDAGSLGKLFSL